MSDVEKYHASSLEVIIDSAGPVGWNVARQGSVLYVTDEQGREFMYAIKEVLGDGPSVDDASAELPDVGSAVEAFISDSARLASPITIGPDSVPDNFGEVSTAGWFDVSARTGSNGSVVEADGGGIRGREVA